MALLMNDFDALCQDLVDIAEVLDKNGYGVWAKNVRTASELLKEQEAQCKSCGREQVVHCKECKEYVKERKHCKRTSWTHGGNWFCGYGKRRERSRLNES